MLKRIVFLSITIVILSAFISAGCERIFLSGDSLKILEVEGGRTILLKSDVQYLAPLTVEGVFPASKWAAEIFIGRGDDTKFEEGEYWTIYKTDGSMRDFRELGSGEIWIGEKTWRIKLKLERGSDMLMRLNGTHQAEYLGRALPNEIVNICRPLIEMPLSELLNLAENSTDTVDIAGMEIPLSDLVMSLVKSDAFYGYAWHDKPRDKTWEKMKLWGYVYIPNGGVRRVKEIYKFEDKRAGYITWCRENLRGRDYLRNFLKRQSQKQGID